MRRIGNVFTRRRLTVVLLLVVAVGAAFAWEFLGVDEHAPAATAAANAATSAEAGSADESGVIRLSRDSWDPAGVKLSPVKAGPFSQPLELTGKIALNEDRIAHVFPLVEGRVHEVKIRLGDKVSKGDLLVVVQSPEVGRSMLQLVEDRMQRDFARTKDQWIQTVARNTQDMIQLMESGATIDEIEGQLTDRPMGEYRDKLMTAYVAHYKSRRTLERLQPLSEGAVAGRQLLEAESEWNGARATLQSLLEQLQQESQQAATMSAQSLKELETRVAVDEANLKIIGFDQAGLDAIDPLQQGEAVSHYPIHAPFDGTIISKDVALLERVSPESQILSVADLSTVWVTADIYEEHLPVLDQLEDRTIQLRSSAWPDRCFDAKVFYTGDVVQESSRTIAMRAVADNPEGSLKPGMFVTVELPTNARKRVVQVPAAAVQEHAGASLVFVHRGGDAFERREIVVGMRTAERVEVRSGLKPGEVIVIAGGFALKSQMLAELLSE